MDFQGGNLSLPEIGAKLEVPNDAISVKQPALAMSISLHQESEDFPDIDDNHFVVTPIISCEPAGFEFHKPVTLTLPHSIPNLKERNNNLRNFYVWLKSKEGRYLSYQYYTFHANKKN